MPELPEVEFAVRQLRAAVEGRRIVAVRVLHAALRRRLLPDEVAAARGGARIVRVERRGKHQLLRLDDGSTLHAHFRMTGDWAIGRNTDPPDPRARAVIDLEDGTRVGLVDPRALSSLSWHPAGHDPLPRLGPEPTDPALDAAALGVALARRRGTIKAALLDQAVMAGVGNIYAAEALWLARIDPRAVARSLSRERRRRLLAAVRRALAKAGRDPGRYRDGTAWASRFNVYDREGKACRRCRAKIRRIVQGARSTYFCPSCQR
jgi:formamidopyrimidine-DNA glycosylase